MNRASLWPQIKCKIQYIGNVAPWNHEVGDRINSLDIKISYLYMLNPYSAEDTFV